MLCGLCCCQIRAAHEEKFHRGERADGFLDVRSQVWTRKKALMLPKGPAGLHGEQAGGGKAEFFSSSEGGFDESPADTLAAGIGI